MRRRGRPGVPGPARRLSVEHSELVVNGLTLGTCLLFLLAGEVPEHPVD